jgi:uncharacterized protein
MIIDFHTHIFPPEIRRERERYFDGEPAFKLLYDSANSRLAGAAELVAMLDEHGIDKAVTFGFPWHSAEYFKRHNDYIIEATQRYPDRLIGLGCCDSLHPAAADETGRCLSAGLAGMGELAFYCNDLDCASLEALAPIMEICGENDRLVMLHTNEPVGHRYPGKTDNTLAQIYALVRRFQKNRIILAHWGAGIFFYRLLKKEVVESLGNVWFDTAASPYLYRPEIYTIAAQLAGKEKILFGSDYPLLAPRRYFDDMARAGLDDHAQRLICGDNAAALLNLTT